MCADIVIGKRFSPDHILVIFSILCEAYQEGVLRLDELGFLVKFFHFKDNFNKLWTLGVGSGSWYYWSDDNWVKGVPSTVLIPVTRDELMEEPLEREEYRKMIETINDPLVQKILGKLIS